MTRAAPVILLVAAEASGDRLGAGLARALRRRAPEARLVGVGGPAMASEGLASPFDISELSVLGIFEGVRAYPRVLRRAREVGALAAAERPHAAVLIDSWGFTLRAARAIRRAAPATRLIKYVGPQVWATRPGRAAVLAGAVDHLLALHAFDAPHFEAAGLATTVVGNAALTRRDAAAPSDAERGRRALGLGPAERLLALLPGSRPAEIQRLGPIFGETLRRLSAARPDLRAALPVADTVASDVEAMTRGWAVRPTLVRGDDAKFEVMAAADAALACSGTVSTELAVAGCPMVIAYRVGPLTHAVLKRLIRVRYATLLNIAADEEIAPEFLQDACTPEALTAAVARLLDDPAAARSQADRQRAALRLMGSLEGDPDERAAETVLSLIDDDPRLD